MTVTDLSANPANPKPGDAVTLTVTVKNSGNVGTPAGTNIGTGIYLDGSATPTTWTNDDRGLAAGASVTLDTVTSLWPGGTWTATAGAHSVVAQADDQHLLAELSETNNSHPLQMSVVDAPVVTPPAVHTAPPRRPPPRRPPR